MGTNSPLPPIYVWDPGDLSIFSTIEQAEEYMEAIDVLANQYVAFDSLGRQLLLQVKAVKRRGLIFSYTVDVVLIKLDESRGSEDNQLKEILCTYLSRNTPAKFDDLYLKDLATLQDLAAARRGRID